MVGASLVNVVHRLRIKFVASFELMYPSKQIVCHRLIGHPYIYKNIELLRCPHNNISRVFAQVSFMRFSLLDVGGGANDDLIPQ